MIVYKAGGVRIDLVREGSSGALVLVPGLDGDPAELAGVIAGYTGSETVYCAAPMLVDDDGEAIETVERLAALMIVALDQAELVVDLPPPVEGVDPERDDGQTDHTQRVPPEV